MHFNAGEISERPSTMHCNAAAISQAPSTMHCSAGELSERRITMHSSAGPRARGAREHVADMVAITLASPVSVSDIAETKTKSSSLLSAAATIDPKPPTVVLLIANTSFTYFARMQ